LEKVIYQGRFAPTPNGPLHTGSLYTALASYLDARSVGGRWFLRIDDLDPLRTRAGMADRIMRSLESLQLYWDDPVLYQSQRLDAYRHALNGLIRQGAVYPCVCSRKTLAAHAVYPGTCRQARPDPAKPYALRLRVPERPLVVQDSLQGTREVRLDLTPGDFIVYRRDQVYAYPLATVLDDAHQGITHVVRGMDLLEVTPGQVYLRTVLQLPSPVHTHIPLLIDRHGQKLSKQNHAPEAATDQPARLLYHLLTLLKQSPPAGLSLESPTVILDWAIRHWNPAPLQNQVCCHE
jgi:glutamyl-Q tRNA(Asp) synthetase